MANQIARHLRKHQTIAETKLWRELRKLRHHGYHFVGKRRSQTTSSILLASLRW
jgi:very-short-patch-repair endonuclease